MSEHLSALELNAFADGELKGEELARVSAHLAACLACSSQCLSLTALKRETAAAGRRYEVPRDFQRRMNRVATAGRTDRARWARWAAAVAMVATCILLAMGWSASRARIDDAALVGQITDQHIATLAANAPQVISTERHTVKPWFEGKLPFSFNLPASLPPDMSLDGANLTYLRGRPVAQLLFSIGRHRASVFVEQSSGAATLPKTERAGFHISSFRTAELEGIGVSDADPARLNELVASVRAAQ
jgi:anti-sigma factor RsiW